MSDFRRHGLSQDYGSGVSNAYYDLDLGDHCQGPPTRSERHSADDRLQALKRTIEAEIIPRLMLAHRDRAVSAAPVLSERPVGQSEIDKLACLVLANQFESAWAQIEDLRRRGVGLETLFLDVLAPTARYLGERWESDDLDFAAVTVGLMRLQRILRELVPAFETEITRYRLRRRALLAAAPGEQHRFGLAMVAEFLRRDGWDVWDEPLSMRTKLIETVRADWFDVFGLSCGTEVGLETLTTTIAEMRDASRNRVIGVLVGGPIFNEHPEYVRLVGADASASDAKKAVNQANGLLAGKRGENGND